MTLRRYILVSILAFACVANALAQMATDDHSCTLTIPEIALLDIEPNIANFTLTLDAPNEAGLPATVGSNGTDNSKWLNYSSAIAQGGTARNITAQVTNGRVPDGLRLQLQAAAHTGSGTGSLGSSTGPVSISEVAMTVISGIGGSYTGDGPNNGHQLIYTLEITDFSQLNFDESTVLEITYTISD